MKKVKFNVCINGEAEVNNDSTDFQKGIDAKVNVAKWVKESLGLPPKHELDISLGYGEVVITNLESPKVELM